MKSPKAPSPPDPQDVAQAQTGQNVATALANQILGQTNQVTPYGSLTTKQTGTTAWQDPYGKTWNLPQYTQTQKLSPQSQQLLDANLGTQNNLASWAKTQTGQLGGLPQIEAPHQQKLYNLPSIRDTFADSGDITKSYGGTGGIEARDRAEAALMSRLNPQLERDQTALTTSLANKGIKLGSAAYDRALGNFGQQSNDARMAAILGAGTEQQRMEDIARNRAAFENQAQQQQFGQDFTRAGFLNDTRQQNFQNRQAKAAFNNATGQQGMQNEVALQNNWFNRLGSILGTGQVQNPQFTGGGGTSMPNIDMGQLFNNQFQGQMTNWQAQLQNNPWNGVMGGLFGLGSSAIMGL